MIKTFVLVILLFSFRFLSFSQNQHIIDSLHTRLKTAKQDTNKAKILNQLSIAYQGNNTDKAMDYAKQTLALSIKIGFKKGIGNAYNIIGGLYDDKGDYSSALEFFKKSLKIKGEIGDKNGIAQNYHNIGSIYVQQGKYPEALKYYFAALKTFEETKNKQGQANNYTSIGNIYFYQNNYPEALKYYNTSLKISEEIGSKQETSSALGNIGVIYLGQGNYPEALKNLKASLKIQEEINYKPGISNSYSDIGLIYEHQGNNPEALKNFFAALKIDEELGDKQGIAADYNNIGKNYTRQKKYNDALQCLKKSLSLSKELGSLINITDVYENLSKLDSVQGNFRQSLTHYKMYITYRDSLFNKENTEKTVQTQMQYEFDKKEALAKLEQEKRDAVAQKKLQKQKLLKDILVAGIVLMFVLFLLGYRYFQARQKLRLNDIRNKIAGDLHDDIGSTLNSISIYSEVAKQKDENQAEALEMIGDASRKIIDAMSDIVWSINADNDSFEKIIFRMKSLAYNLFQAKQIEFTFHSDEIMNEKKLPLEERRNFYLIFKEAVNNLVKYSAATHVSISLSFEDGQIKLDIRDNGIGFDTSQYNAGNGLKSMKRRADEMKAEFILESQKGNGTHLNLIIKK